MIITSMQKFGTDKAIIKFIKIIQEPGICCLGGVAYVAGLAQWMITGTAAVCSAHLKN